jgi:hypothetical protein
VTHALRLTTLLLGGALFLAGCSAGSPPPPSTATPTHESAAADPPTATPTEAPLPTVDPHIVESITSALSTGNADAILPHIGYRPVGCSSQSSPAAPRCPTGQPLGVLTAAFYFSDCTGRYLQPGEIDLPLALIASMRLEGFYIMSARGQPSGQYAAILIDQRPETAGLAWEAIIDDGRIVALIFSCSLTPEQLVELRHYGPAIEP